jgi:hypothetical protein
MLFHSIEDLWNTILSMMPQLPEGKSRLENTSRNFETSPLTSCKAVTHAPLQLINVMPGIRVQDAFLSQHKRQGPPGAFPVCGVVLLWNALSSVAAKQEGYVFETDSIHGRDMLSLAST